MIVTLDLTRTEAESLLDIVDRYEDCGGDLGGWKSSEWDQLSAYLMVTLREALGAGG